MLEIKDLGSGYGRTEVLHGTSMRVDEGALVALLGRNGVGKSTLLKTIIGAIPTTSGSVCMADRDLKRLPVHGRTRLGIAYVPQGRDIFPGLSVIDNLRVAGYACKTPQRMELLEEILEEFPVLREKRAQPGGSLSGGQQQILALGRALMTKPRLLLLDEPSEGIQPSIVDQIADSIRRINKDRGLTVVLVEQNLDFAARVCDHAYLMDRGEIVRDIPMRSVLDDRALQHEYLGV